MYHLHIFSYKLNFVIDSEISQLHIQGFRQLFSYPYSRGATELNNINKN